MSGQTGGGRETGGGGVVSAATAFGGGYFSAEDTTGTIISGSTPIIVLPATSTPVPLASGTYRVWWETAADPASGSGIFGAQLEIDTGGGFAQQAETITNDAGEGPTAVSTIVGQSTEFSLPAPAIVAVRVSAQEYAARSWTHTRTNVWFWRIGS